MNGRDVRPTLDARAPAGDRLAQAAGSFVTGSPLPQALIQRRQRLDYELRLCKLVILSWSAPQPAAGDSAVAQPTTAALHQPRPRPRTDRGYAVTPHPVTVTCSTHQTPRAEFVR